MMRISCSWRGSQIHELAGCLNTVCKMCFARSQHLHYPLPSMSYYYL
jgi:hypothetical protein